MSGTISSADDHPRSRVNVRDSQMSYVTTGSGDPIVFLHGNPTSSYLWRNVIPHVSELGWCLAPDLIGMGRSAASPGGAYRFLDHADYLDAWFEAMDLRRNVTLVLHDWGSALGFYGLPDTPTGCAPSPIWSRSSSRATGTSSLPAGRKSFVTCGRRKAST